MIDLKTPGTYEAQLTVEATEARSEKLLLVKFHGLSGRVRVSRSKEFDVPLRAGETGLAKIEVRTELYQGAERPVAWLSKFSPQSGANAGPAEAPSGGAAMAQRCDRRTCLACTALKCATELAGAHTGTPWTAELVLDAANLFLAWLEAPHETFVRKTIEKAPWEDDDGTA